MIPRDPDGLPTSNVREPEIAERKQTQQALEEAHQRFTTILDAMDAKVYLADMDTHEVLFMNQPLLEAFGPAEGRPCYRVLQGLDAPCPFCTNDKLVNVDGSPAGVYTWEFQNQLNRRWYELRDCALRWTDGRLVRMEVATDITERKRMELHLRQSEERFRLAFENANTGMCLVDPQGRLMQVNDKMSAIFGYSRHELEGMTVNDLTYPDDLTISPEYMSKAIQGLVDCITFDKRYRHRDGHLVYGEVASSLVRDHQGQPLYFISQVKDVTARRLAEAHLRASEERFRLVVEHAIDNIWTMGPDQRMRFLSPSIATLVGYGMDEYRELSLEQILMPDSLRVAAAYFAALDARSTAGLSLADFPFRGELELRAKDGTGVWTEIIATPLVDAEGRMTELAGVTRDIRERKRYEAKLQQAREATEIAYRILQAANTELQRLAATDRLTGIWNRLHFDEVAVTEIERATRYGQPLSLLLFDIDHFKTINDTHGHLAGDQVLVELTRRVRQHLRTGDLLARWGGEEFVVLLPHTRGEDALELAEKLRHLIAGEPFPAAGQVTSSFGVAEFRPHETSDLWLTRVDGALYAAKAGGRNRVCLAEPS
jgi:diguanylate cyclase (GGDEF)-like protein/PAS domain S-box-containing protein